MHPHRRREIIRIVRILDFAEESEKRVFNIFLIISTQHTPLWQKGGWGRFLLAYQHTFLDLPPENLLPLFAKEGGYEKQS